MTPQTFVETLPNVKGARAGRRPTSTAERRRLMAPIMISSLQHKLVSVYIYRLVVDVAESFKRSHPLEWLPSRK